MSEKILVVADHHSWLVAWKGTIKRFEEVTPELLVGYDTVVLAPGANHYADNCREIFGWKKQGLLGNTRLILGTYKGRHLWAPEYDELVFRWVVHARSERQVLDSDRLAFAPVCLVPPRRRFEPGDDGYLFMGGRKWRELGVGMTAMSQSGYPSKVITDLAPHGDFAGVDIRREKIPKDEYSAVMARARLVLVPLKQTPISHGHVDVVTAIMLGKPVLVTAGCSCDDYIDHGKNGLLVRDNSVEAWVEAIQEAWPQADALAAGSRERAPRYNAHRYADYIREICAMPG